MKRTLVGLFALVALAFAAPVSAESILRTTTTRGGAPAPNVEYEVQLLNEGKLRLGTTGTDGTLDLVIGMANRTKPFRVQVIIYDCPNDVYLVVLLEAGADAAENKDCRKRAAAFFVFGRARTLVVDVLAGTALAQGGQSFLGTARGKAILAGAAGVAAVTLAAGGGSSATTPPANNPPANTPGTGNPPTSPGPSTPIDPAGPYNVVNTVSSDPGNHRTVVNLESTTVLTITFDSNNVARIVCPPTSKYTLLTGPGVLNSATGEKTITAEGRANVGSISNVLYRFIVTIATTGANAGRLTGQLTIGSNGELPGGQAIVYSVTGQKQ